MARHKKRVDLIDKRSQAPQMPAINPAGTADRNPDRVHGHWKVPPRLEKKLCRMWIGEKVFRVNFEPGRLGSFGRDDDRCGGHDFRHMRKPRYNTGAGRRMAT